MPLRIIRLHLKPLFEYVLNPIVTYGRIFIIFTAMNIIMLGSAGGNPVPQTICLSNSPSELELFHSVYVPQIALKLNINSL